MLHLTLGGIQSARYGGYGLAIVDPGEPAYQAWMVGEHLKQAKRLPATVGIALDEQQYLGLMNTRRDDGCGWYVASQMNSDRNQHRLRRAHTS